MRLIFIALRFYFCMRFWVNFMRFFHAEFQFTLLLQILSNLFEVQISAYWYMVIYTLLFAIVRCSLFPTGAQYRMSLRRYGDLMYT